MINTYWVGTGGTLNADCLDQSVDIDGASSISQTFETVIGETYVVEFFYSQHPNNSATGYVTVEGNTTHISETLVSQIPNSLTDMQWQHFFRGFVADGTTTTLTIQGDAANGGFGFAVDHVRVAVAELTITTTSLPPVRTEINVSQQLEAVFGEPPYAWSLVDGTLPPGVVLSPDGVLSGTPSQAGTYTFTVQVMDSLGNTAEMTYTLNVVVAIKPFVNGNFDIPDISGTFERLFSSPPGFGWEATRFGGSTVALINTTWNGIGGTANPDGIDQSVDIQGASSISQSFDTVPGKGYTLELFYSYNYTGEFAIGLIMVEGNTTLLAETLLHDIPNSPTDMQWEPFSRLFVADSDTTTLTIQGDERFVGFSVDHVRITLQGLTIITESSLVAKLGDSFSRPFEAISGDRPLSWSLVTGTLPSGVNFSSDGILSGTPTEAGEFTFTVRVTDSQGDFAEKTFTLKVDVTLPPAEIRAHKTGTVAVPGRVLDYFIVVENVGSIIAEDLFVTEFLEPWFTFVSSTPIPTRILSVEDIFPLDITGNTYDAFIEWDVSSLAPGDFRILSYRASIDPTFSLGLTVIGFATLSPIPLPSQIDFDREVSYIQIWVPAVKSRCEDDVEPNKCLPEGLHGGEKLRAICYKKKDPDKDPPSLPHFILYKDTSIAPRDPNEKIVAAKRFIQPDQLLVYPIHFENIGDVEALDVFVTDILDSNLDEATLGLLTPEGASFNTSTRTLRWELRGRNLQPGETGNVLFSIRPKLGLPSGAEIRNRAEIQFEIFEPLITPEVINIIDSTPPTCTMDALPEETTTPFSIAWSGTDAIGEIDTYTIFASVDGGGYTPYLQGTRETSATVEGEVGSVYRFICIATDTAGNIEVQDPLAEAITGVTKPAVLEVAIDIKPGSDPNAINPHSKGDIPIAILTTNGFDATTVDPLSVRFGPNGAVEAHGKGHIEDADGHGDNDLVLHFRTQETGIQCGDTEVGLTGMNVDGQEIEGADFISTVGCE